VIAQDVTFGRPSVASQIASIARHFAVPSGAVVGQMQSIEMVRNLVRRDAFVMAYCDCFFIMGLALVAAIAALWLIPAPRGE
jgi:DHA2 family multidrug resistance protein